MDWLKKVTDFIMPPEQEDMEEEVVETKESRESVPLAGRVSREEEISGRRVANGEPIYYGNAEPVSQRIAESTVQVSRPQLKVHTTKVPELKVKVYAPVNFEQVTDIADDLTSKKAVIVNYEKVDLLMQRRICDFVNGVCYVTDGDARRISAGIVLYVPEGIDVAEAMAAAAMAS